MKILKNVMVIGMTLLALAYVVYVLCCGFNFPLVRVELLRISAVWLSIVFFCNCYSKKDY